MAHMRKNADGSSSICDCPLDSDHEAESAAPIEDTTTPEPIVDEVAERPDVITGTADEGEVGEIVE